VCHAVSCCAHLLAEGAALELIQHQGLHGTIEVNYLVMTHTRGGGEGGGTFCLWDEGGVGTSAPHGCMFRALEGLPCTHRVGGYSHTTLQPCPCAKQAMRGAAQPAPTTLRLLLHACCCRALLGQGGCRLHCAVGATPHRCSQHRSAPQYLAGLLDAPASHSRECVAPAAAGIIRNKLRLVAGSECTNTKPQQRRHGRTHNLQRYTETHADQLLGYWWEQSNCRRLLVGANTMPCTVPPTKDCQLLPPPPPQAWCRHTCCCR